MAIGKCPKCESVISSVKIEDIIVEGGIIPLKGVSYLCPSCQHILSVAIDPVALQGGNVEYLE